MICVYIDSKLSKFDDRIKYTISFVFDTLGYDYKLISKLEELNDNDIVILYGLIKPTLKEAYLISVNKKLFYIPFEVDLYQKGSLTKEKLREYTRIVNIHQPLPVISREKFLDPINCVSRNEIFYGTFSFDVLGNIYFNLTDSEKVNFTTTDKYGRISEADSYLAKFSHTPYVNAFLWLIDNFIKESLTGESRHFLVKKEFWPKAEKFGAAISHTVDKLQKWNFGKIVLTSFSDLLYFYKIKYLLRRTLSRLKYMVTNDEEYWNFGIINEIEEKYKINSTFFWGTKSDTDVDIDYDFEDADLLAELSENVEQGNEIALLASYYSNKSDFHGKQISNLQNLSRKKVFGVRQNYFRYDDDVTNALHNKHNFDYDSSKTCLERNGFKNGIGFPYYIFPAQDGSDIHRAENTNMKCLEIPLSFSDGNLKISNSKTASYDTASGYLMNMIRIVKNFNGLLTFDFSIANFADISYNAKLFDELLDKLSEEKVFMGTYLEISRWWKLRNSVIIKEISNSAFVVYFPLSTGDFSISIFSNLKLQPFDIPNVSIEDNRIHFKNIAADTKIMFELDKPVDE